MNRSDGTSTDRRRWSGWVLGRKPSPPDLRCSATLNRSAASIRRPWAPARCSLPCCPAPPPPPPPPHIHIHPAPFQRGSAIAYSDTPSSLGHRQIKWLRHQRQCAQARYTSSGQPGAPPGPRVHRRLFTPFVKLRGLVARFHLRNADAVGVAQPSPKVALATVSESWNERHRRVARCSCDRNASQYARSLIEASLDHW